MLNCIVTVNAFMSRIFFLLCKVQVWVIEIENIITLKEVVEL